MVAVNLYFIVLNHTLNIIQSDPWYVTIEIREEVTYDEIRETRIFIDVIMDTKGIVVDLYVLYT